MFSKAASQKILWDFVVPETVEDSQRWILSTMQRYGQELVGMLWRILGDEQDVCDAYQSVFLQLAHRQEQRKPERIKAYVFRTASNVAISMLRRKIAERKTIFSVASCGESSNSSVDGFDSRCLTESLRCHITQLPEYLRNVIILRDLGELSYAQVAKILGISSGTARVYRCKAIQLLAARMNR